MRIVNVSVSNYNTTCRNPSMGTSASNQDGNNMWLKVIGRDPTMAMEKIIIFHFQSFFTADFFWYPDEKDIFIIACTAFAWDLLITTSSNWKTWASTCLAMLSRCSCGCESSWNLLPCQKWKFRYCVSSWQMIGENGILVWSSFIMFCHFGQKGLDSAMDSFFYNTRYLFPSSFHFLFIW